MYTTKLRKVGGSVMLAVPPALLDMLHLKSGAEVALSLEHDRLVVAPKPRPRYTLEELLAQSDYRQPLTEEERAWIDAPAAGDELI
jgi:antitoxin ChpS